MNNKAILVIDMIKDAFKKRESPLAVEGWAILPLLNQFLLRCREASMQVIFTMDSFLRSDYFLRDKKPYAIRGTEGAEVIDEIGRHPSDIYLPKRRFSAFYKTDLDQTLRVMGIDIVALTGVNTHVCVLATALDALSYDFRTIIIEDCCAAATKEVHQTILDIYRKSSLYPFLKIMSSKEFLAQHLEEKASGGL
jgi:nicotinamidase-related amidase